MALLKSVKLANGIVVTYHRIAMIKNDTNQQTTILLESYLDESGRQYEKDYADGKIEGEPVFPYSVSRYISAYYIENLTISRAYSWIKEHLQEFKDAEDILDEEYDPSEISGDEFMAMLEEVL